MYYLILVITLLKFSLEGVRSETIVDLNETNFNDTISEGRWLISFYAPWCPHCQKLEPILQDAARLVNLAKYDLKFGKVDCSSQTKLAERLSIQGYPTLKYAYRGRFLDYTLGRNLNDFVEFAKKLVGPSLKILTDDNIEKFKNDKSLIKFLLYVASNDTHLTEYISDFTELWRIHDHIEFSVCDNLNLIKSKLDNLMKEIVSPSLILFNHDTLAPVYHFNGDWNKTIIESWMEDHAFPNFVEFTINNWNHLSKKRKVVLSLLDPKGGVVHESLSNLMKSVAFQYKFLKRENYRFGWFDVQQYSRFISQFGFSTYPAYLIYDMANDVFYANYSQELTELATIQFIDAVKANKIVARGGGSGVLGLLRQFYLKISWQVYDHPYIFCGLFGFIILFMFLLFYITDPNDDLSSIEKEKND